MRFCNADCAEQDSVHIQTDQTLDIIQFQIGVMVGIFDEGFIPLFSQITVYTGNDPAGDLGV